MEQEKKVKVKKKFYKRWWFWAIVLVVLIGLIGNCGGDSNETKSTIAELSTGEEINSNLDGAEPENKETPKPVETPTPEPTPAFPVFQSGMYKVGSDLSSGEYFILSGTSCYYAVTSDSSGTLDSIIVNGNFETFTIVTVEEGNYFEFNRGEAALLVDIAANIPNIGLNDDGTYTEGTYKAGLTIPAGEYKLIPNGSAYVAVLSDTKGGIRSIVSNDNFDGEKYITIKDGQYLEVVRATIKPVE